MAITIREYLGDEKIAQLENMGFLPSLITDMAKRQYAADKQAKRNELSDAGLDGKLVQGIMRGDINEKEAKNAQKFEDFGSKKHGWGLGAAKTLTGIANTLERAGDFINPFYDGKHDENGNYIYQNSIEQALRPKIKNAEKLRDDYEKATGETAWGSRLAEIGTEMVGDPINFIGGAGLLSKGSKLAQFGKKTLFFAGTGAASGGVMALGEGKNDEETLKNIGYGAAGGFVLGHAIDQGIQGISKLIAKRQANKVANEANAIESAENSGFLDGNNNASGDSVVAQLKTAETMTAREFATKEVGLDEDTATNVLKEAMQGKEKSDWTDADTYADIAKFKNFEIQREYAKAYGEKIQATQASINNAREQSAIRYADTQKAINEYQKQGMSPSAARELINAKFKPSVDEINYTRAYNDGSDVDARLAGQGIFYALEKDIAAQAYTPEIYAVRLKQRGFSDESVQAFTQAYVSKDINIAKDYANSKVADAYENKIQREVANEIRDRDEVGDGFVNEEAKNNGLSDSVSNIGDNASRTGGRQASDKQILRQGGRNTSSASQTKRTAQSDEQMEQRPAFKTDGDTDATAAIKQMVEEQGGGANIGGGLAANSNAHLGSGLVAGTLNSIDEDGNFNPNGFAAGFLAGLAGSKAVAITTRKITPQLYNKILGVAKKMPQMAKDNPKLLGKLYANGKGVSLNSFAGEKAITANVGKLDQAKAMLEKGADEVEIWQKTGWFKDKDGAWKFEIGDNKARLNPDFQSGGKLGELLDHEELFKAYPELKDVMVVKIGGETPDGAALSVKDAAQREKRGIYNVAFNNKKSTIIRKDLKTIDEIIKFEKGEADYVVNGERKNGYGALHIQKHLDTQNNGWVTKQEYLDMGQMLRKSTMQEADDKRIYTYFNDEGIRFRLVIGVGKNKERVISFYSNRKPLKAGLSYNSQNYDGNLPLNDDIIAQNGTKGYYRPSKNEIGLSDLGDKSALMHEVQHAIQEIEGFARGGNTNKIESSLWFKSGELAYKLKKLAPPPEFYVLEKKRSSLSSKLMLEADKIIEQNPLMEDNIIENTFNKKNFDKLKLRNTKELKEFKDVLTKYHETDNALGDMVKNHPIFKERKNITDQIDALTKKDSYEEYKKLHGEVEARNVQNRLNLDGKTHPHETFDVNPNETIVSKEDGISYSRRIEEIKSEHPNVEKELDESIATINKESFNDSNFKDGLIGKFDTKEITTQQLGKSINLSNKQLTILKNDIKNADFKVINESKIYFDKIGKDGDKKRFFVDIAEDGNLRVDAYAKSQIDNIPVKQSALEELAGTGDAARLKNMSFEVKAAYHNELDPIKKEAILKTAELNKLKKAAQSGDKVAVAKFEEFKAKNLDKDGNIKDGLRLC